MSDEYGGGELPGIGHGIRGHKPDQTWNDPEKGMKMAEMVFNELKELAKSCGGNCPGKTWNEIKSRVELFMNFEPETYTELQFGVWPVRNATAKGYDRKIRILNPNFGIAPIYLDDRKWSNELP